MASKRHFRTKNSNVSPTKDSDYDKNIWKLCFIFVLLRRKLLHMATMTQKIKDLQSKRIAYQTEKTKEYMARVASYLSLEDQKILYSGNGFVEVPEQERLRERIDAYPYLIP